MIIRHMKLSHLLKSKGKRKLDINDYNISEFIEKLINYGIRINAEDFKDTEERRALCLNEVDNFCKTYNHEPAIFEEYSDLRSMVKNKNLVISLV